jgi:hypothetical protein
MCAVADMVISGQRGLLDHRMGEISPVVKR